MGQGKELMQISCTEDPAQKNARKPNSVKPLYLAVTVCTDNTWTVYKYELFGNLVKDT